MKITSLGIRSLLNRTNLNRLISTALTCLLTACAGNHHASNPTSTKTPTILSKLEHNHQVSDILPLSSGPDAFAVRIALARQAKHTIDLQYYIWHDDLTGKLLAGALVEAAQRGVKVRLLLDDVGTAAKDRNLLILDSHPNIDVKLFNPISLRSSRMLGMILNFKTSNRRMHNKSFTVDQDVTVIGGRNIGDEYFGVSAAVNFADFDVAVRGPAASQAQTAFALYWDSKTAVPITQVTKEVVPPAEIHLALQLLLAHRTVMQTSPYAQVMKHSKIMTTPYGDLPFFKGEAILLADNPEKIRQAPEETHTHLAPRLRQIIDQMQKEAVLVSPYFVPGKPGVEWLAGLNQRKVAVTVITNSLAATDVAAVHAGYARYRKSLLQTGVEVYEVKAAAPTEPRKSGSSSSGFNLTGSSAASLHAKTFIFDRRYVFVGSLNMDPRSIKLNTEMGMLIDCPELASQMLKRKETNLLDHAYKVDLVEGRLRWTSRENGLPITLNSEPPTTFMKRLLFRISAMLPIEGQL